MRQAIGIITSQRNRQISNWEVKDEQLSELKLTLGGDKGEDTRNFVAALRARQITPACDGQYGTARGSGIDGRTTRHETIRSVSGSASGWKKSSAG